ncbi:hypothetical protein [Actinokineospora bangkokensis]|uniref:Uncharacterized protein n=1 Tax=Actinokineospora bangkokensis TaxID=1193682 RepID=A0A1Q9LR36_9PSEU|nr:hypothetical protein [Actinokineospora bangkokensis]OLR94517.1 hypothetical protein BJP25_12300 [Actinokineospora bangkokensis]
MTAVTDLTRRLADTPPVFLDETAASVPAVVSDVLTGLGGPPLTALQARAFELGEPNWRRLVLVTSWLAAGLAPTPTAAGELHHLLVHPLVELAGVVAAERFTADADRREELARLVLHALGVVPEGETAAQAEDRLSTVDSLRRRRLLAEAARAEERAAAIRKAMADKRAQEAAARYSQV